MSKRAQGYYWVEHRCVNGDYNKIGHPILWDWSVAFWCPIIREHGAWILDRSGAAYDDEAFKSIGQRIPNPGTKWLNIDKFAEVLGRAVFCGAVLGTLTAISVTLIKGIARNL